jgi:hypothetical protein
MDRVTPQELHAELDRVRGDEPWWRMAVQLDTDVKAFHRMRNGRLSAPLRRRVEAWLAKNGRPT